MDELPVLSIVFFLLGGLFSGRFAGQAFVLKKLELPVHRKTFGFMFVAVGTIGLMLSIAYLPQAFLLKLDAVFIVLVIIAFRAGYKSELRGKAPR